MSARFICRMLARTATCLALLAGFLPAIEGAPFIPNDVLRKDFWDTDGTINAIVASNGVVYVGGSFSYVAPKGSKLVSLDSATGALQTDFPSFYGAGLYAILDDGAGG